MEFTTLFTVLRELIDEEADQPIIIFQGDGGEAVLLRDQYLADHPHYPSTKRRIGLADFDALIERKHAAIYPILTWYYCFTKDKTDAEMTQNLQQIRRKYRLEHLRPSIKDEVKAARAVGQALNRVAELSGGSVFWLETPIMYWGFPWLHPHVVTTPADVLGRASSVYSQVLSKINQRYVIGYYPANRARDGKRRKVEIQVRNHPEYTVESRRYYFGPK